MILFQEMGVVHRIKYRFSYLFLFLFYLLNLFLISNNSHLYSLSHIALIRDSIPYWTASVCCLLLTFSHLNLSLYNPSLPFANGSWTYVDRPSLTGTSKRNNYTKMIGYKIICWSLKCSDKWPSMPISLCLLGGNLNVHAKPEKIMYICLLKVWSM